MKSKCHGFSCLLILSNWLICVSSDDFCMASSKLLEYGFFDLALSSSSWVLLVDTSLFILWHSSYVIFLLVYVDDIILIGSPNAPFNDPLPSSQTEFAMKDLGPLNHFLGIEVHLCLQGIFVMHETNWIKQ